jgi:hypothetical protein
MRFQDLFVPRWQHSNPEKRQKAVARLSDIKLLKQISEHDDDPMVRKAALANYNRLAGEKVTVSEQE